MPQKKVNLEPVGPKGTPGRQSTLTKAGNALSKAKKRATENATKPSVKSLGARLDQAAANEKRAAARKANKAAKSAARAAAQAEMHFKRAGHLNPHNTYHQTHNNIEDIRNNIDDAHINGNHDDLVNHAHHLVNVLNMHGSALKVGTGRTSQSRGHVEHVKSLLRDVGKNKEVSDHLRAKAKRIAYHLTRHVPDAPKAPKAAKPGIVDRIKRMFEEVELHEGYSVGEMGTDELVNRYKAMTPGQEKDKKTIETIKRVVESRRFIGGYVGPGSTPPVIPSRLGSKPGPPGLGRRRHPVFGPGRPPRKRRSRRI